MMLSIRCIVSFLYFLNSNNMGNCTISSKPHISEIEYHAEYREKLVTIRYENEGLPLQCRKDVCLEESTSDRRKGNFTWKLALIGQRYHSPCPYGSAKPDSTEEKHAVRDCVLNSGNSSWTDPNYDGCGDPITARRLKAIDFDMKRRDKKNNLTELCQFMEKKVAYVAELYENNKNVPILEDDVTCGGKLLEKYLSTLKQLNQSVPFKLLKPILFISDRILGAPMKSVSKSNRKKIRIIRALVLLADLSKMEETTSVSYFMRHFSFQIRVVCNLTEFNMTDGIRRGENSTTTVSVALPANATGPMQATLVIAYDIQRFMPKLQLCQRRTFKIVQQASKNGSLGYQNTPKPANLVRTPIFITQCKSGHLPKGLTYLNIKYIRERNATVRPVTVTLDPPLGVKHTTRNLTCGHLANPLSKMLEKDQQAHVEWMQCKTLSAGNNARCRCSRVGMYGAFSLNGFAVNTIQLITKSPNGDPLSKFLRFPYSEELYFIGHILRALSFLCLILTLLSYLIFSNTRHGTATCILLQLCMSLVALLVVVSISEFLVGSRRGCRWANGLRLYFILVSLMWNGTEAVNMYLMLIKVFDSHIHRFVLKAGIICWGAPAVIALVTVCVNSKAFDGEFIMCTFRCNLAEDTMYFSFLLPMGIIIVNNTVIFIMVMRCLLKSNSAMSPDQKRPRLVQLVGAVTLLALLGIPWAFSAFGAIDARKGKELEKLEGIFHAVFVIFVNIQGCFIFMFHCVRVKDIRNSWKTALTSGVFSTTPTSAAASYSHTNSDKKDKYLHVKSNPGSKSMPHKADTEGLVPETSL